MGIRFLCPNGHKLNVKADLAGMRGSCPQCGVRLVIPSENGDTGEVVAVAPQQVVRTGAAAAAAVAAMGWYIRTAAGEQFGPATADEFRALITAGRVTPDTPIWRDGWPAWKHARDVPDELPAPLAAVPLPSAPTAPPIPKINIPPIPEPPSNPVVASPLVVDPALAATSVAITPPAALGNDAALIANSIEPDQVDSTSGAYIAQRQRAKRKQVTLAILMLIAVLILAVVLAFVLTSNLGGEEETPATTPAPVASSSSQHFTTHESELT
jgi:hypothetical protein